MKAIVGTFLSLGLLVAVGGGEAVSQTKRYGRHCDEYCQRFPSASERQLKNARAFDRGEYYETDPNAHPAGSRGWWYLREQQGRGRRS